MCSKKNNNKLNPYTKYRPSGLPWLGDIPEHWEVRRNGRLFAQRNQTGFSDLPILEVSLKTGVRVRDLDNSKRKQVMTDRDKYKRAVQGDIAYNMMRMWQGAVGMAPVDGLVSPAYIVAQPFPGTESSYFSYLFRTGVYKNEVNQYSRGIVSDRNRLYWDEFKQMPSVCPPPEEQQSIALFLNWQITQMNKIIHNKHRLGELFAERRKVTTYAAMKSGGTRYSRLGVVTHRVERPIERLASESYTPIGLHNWGKGIFHKELTSSADLGDSSFSMVKQGDLVFSGQFAWEGAVALAGETDDGCVASHRYPMFYCIPDLVDASYLWSFFCMKEGHLLLDLNSRGAAGRNRPLNAGTLMKEKIPVPPLHLQQKVAQLVNRETDLRQKIARDISLLREYYVRLIADVVCGKFDVRGVKVPETTEEGLLALNEDTAEADDTIYDEGDMNEAD